MRSAPGNLCICVCFMPPSVLTIIFGQTLQKWKFSSSALAAFPFQEIHTCRIMLLHTVAKAYALKFQHLVFTTSFAMIINGAIFKF
jgi:hypothetical protein